MNGIAKATREPGVIDRVNGTRQQLLSINARLEELYGRVIGARPTRGPEACDGGGEKQPPSLAAMVEVNEALARRAYDSIDQLGAALGG